jgi:hypothetical protein
MQALAEDDTALYPSRGDGKWCTVHFRGFGGLAASYAHTEPKSVSDVVMIMGDEVVQLVSAFVQRGISGVGSAPFANVAYPRIWACGRRGEFSFTSNVISISALLLFAREC